MLKRVLESTKYVIRDNISPLNSFSTSSLSPLFLKELDDIPSAKGLPLIGTTLSLILAGSSPKLHNYIDKRHKELGPIFKESIGPIPCVFISDPNAIRAIFSNEGKYPVHVLPEAWITYNNLHNISRGLFFMNGAEWLHFRRILNPLLLKGNQSWLEESCVPAIENLLDELKKFSYEKNSYPHMEHLLYKWSLETIISVLIGPETFNSAKSNLEQQISELASTVHVVFETSSKMALIPSKLAVKLNLSRWRNFENSVTSALRGAANLVEVLLDNYCENNNAGLLGILKNQINKNEVVKIVTDLILAAGDTTAYSMEWLLYLVGKHKTVQEKLRYEVNLYKGKQESITLNSYIKNTVKEALRIYPVAPFITRILPEPIKIKGYNIPSGTTLVLSIFTTSRDEENFKDPLTFNPDRWIRSENKCCITQSANLPFAIGARSCIGKKLAETQLQLTLASLVENYNIDILNNKDVDVILKMVAVPAEQIKFRFSLI